MSITITQSNNKDYIGRDFLFHLKKDQIVIGHKILVWVKNLKYPVMM